MGYTSDASSRRTVTGALLFDADALVSVHKPRSASAAPPMTRPPRASDRGSVRSTDSGFRPGATSNCASRYARHRRHSSGSNATASSNRSSRRVSAKETNEPCFFVGEADEDLSTSVVVLGSNGDVITTSASDRGASRRTAPTRVSRSASLPVAHSPAPSRAGSALQQRTTHATSDAKKLKRHKNVTFKNAYEPEIMPDRRPRVQTYDELLFNVGGLYHTLSYLHDPDFLDDPDTSTDTNSESDQSSSDRQMQMERSMQLMIAEFLYRSAVYLGYPPDDNVWVPGFREKKKFSSNDVKRWRRLAHFNWEEEEAAFEMQRSQRQASARERAQTQERARASSSATGLRATVSDWLHRRRASSTPVPAPVSSTVMVDKPLPPLVLEPPLVSSLVDLSRLVEIANSCVSYGAFRFTEKQIRKLCNVPIKHY